MLSKLILPAILGLFVGTIHSQDLGASTDPCLTLLPNSAFQLLCYESNNATISRNGTIQNTTTPAAPALKKRAPTSVIITSVTYPPNDSGCTQTPVAAQVSDRTNYWDDCNEYTSYNYVNTCVYKGSGNYAKYYCAENVTATDTESALLKSLPSAFWWESASYSARNCSTAASSYYLSRAGNVQVTVANSCSKITCSGTSATGCNCDGTGCITVSGACNSGSSGKCVGSGVYSAASINKPYLWIFLLAGVVWASA